MRSVAQHWYPLAVAALAVGILVVGGFLLATAAPELARGDAAPTHGAGATPTPSPRSAMLPIGIQMAPDSDCAACHVTASGTVGTKPIPVMAHPLWGWRNCTACHSDESLVKSAPGHSGLHKDDCLVCHQVRDAAETAAPRPHHVYNDQPCVSCHGVKAEAPLPTDMEGRTNCWVCHGSTEFEDLFGDRAEVPSPSATAGPG